MVMAMLWDLEGRPCTSLKLIGVFDMRLSEKRGSTQWVGSLVGGAVQPTQTGQISGGFQEALKMSSLQGSQFHN